MQRIIIIGNSGSGKSTLARSLAERNGFPVLSLDSIAWKNTMPPERQPLEASHRLLDDFTSANKNWILEGCYADILRTVLEHADKLYFLNPGTDQCISNCKNRPWEQDKYKSKADQDDNLPMLIEWVRQYETRQDEYSLAAHRKMYDSFKGEKEEMTTNMKGLL